MTHKGAVVQDLISCARALADEVQRFVASEPDDRGFGAAAGRMADAVASAHDAERAAYEAQIMLSSTAGGLSQLFGGGNHAVGQRMDALRTTLRALLGATIAPTGIAGTLNTLLTGTTAQQREVGVLIPNQPQQYRTEDATLLALVMTSLVHADPLRPSAEFLLDAVDNLDMFEARLPIEVAAYAATLDRESGPDFIEFHCENIVDEANDDRPDRPPLGSATIIGPEAFLREVRAAFETGHTSFSQGSPVENDAIALAASLGQLPRTYDLRSH
ncbi:hypothetical protein ACQCX2_09570 [Propionibacteriaceae bacterium Y1700]|uniref:hypothetical protein n=1 Tax=Microlunatus sp. Y1700 TaxID=3418487 RepID=UPI003DA78151